ncbi:follicular epithelium yolk protein subunit [Cytophagales bacterium RKSG123]|nr:follicular epithelium yolk protein subunit [Xanthovirga aplysinae]
MGTFASTLAAGVNVSIDAGADLSSSSVTASGSELHLIDSNERDQFDIQDANLKNAVEKYFGKKPNDVFVTSPTPWGDLYKTYGWEEVKTKFTVKSAVIQDITSEPVIIATKTFTNNSSIPATFDAAISDQVSNTVESNWSTQTLFRFEQKFKYNISFLGTGGGGETNLIYQETDTEGGSESLTTTVGSSSGVSVELQPGQSVISTLSASRGTMKVRVTYTVSLEGYVATNYNPTYKDHHFWALWVNNVLGGAGMTKTYEITQDLDIGYFSNSEIVLEDADNGKVMKTMTF